MSRAYYNENNPAAAAKLRQMIRRGDIADGYVDERSIIDVTPNDLEGYTQCHFFAGIGGWSLALRYAGWPDTRPVWTGSCPCQPFSTGGQQAGFVDERHLWPAWFWLIRQSGPRLIFGEQVASADGRAWFDFVSLDLEALGYAAGATDLCAAGAGAHHIRQRLYWGAGRGLPWPAVHAPPRLGHVHDPRPQRWNEQGNGADQLTAWPPGVACDWVECTDGFARPVEPGTFPMAYGISPPVELIRGYGNAIVPQLAAEFIGVFPYAD